MHGKLATRASATKSARSQTRKPNFRNRNQISPVMQKVKSLLPTKKAAQHLAILIDEPLGNCQKLLSGDRVENSKQLVKLLRSRFGRDVLFVVVAGSKEDWIVRYRRQLDVNKARKQLVESQRAIEALQLEIAE